MRAFVVTAPFVGVVEEVEPPRPAARQVVVDVERVGVCGTDVEFFTGEMAYLHQGHAAYPIRLGHEWCGTVAAVGSDVDLRWIGRRVTGDTMLGCGRCARCRDGRHHVCDDRYEVGIRGGWPGALAEQVLVPASSLLELPASLDPTVGAMVEPGGNAWRTVAAADIGAGSRVLVLGPGTIGLLAARFAVSVGAEVHVVGITESSLAFARNLGVDRATMADELAPLPFDAVIDATTSPDQPGLALELVEPGRRVVYIGLAGVPSFVDTRQIALRDLVVVGILGASAGLAGAIDGYASGRVDPTPLVAATVGLDDVARVLAGWRPADAGPGPKIHVEPRRAPAG